MTEADVILLYHEIIILFFVDDKSSRIIGLFWSRRDEMMGDNSCGSQFNIMHRIHIFQKKCIHGGHYFYTHAINYF